MKTLDNNAIEMVSGGDLGNVIDAAAGAAVGAAVGFLVGGPVGAVAGGISGGMHALGISLLLT